MATIFLILISIPAFAGSIESNGSAIVIGPEASWKPSDACTVPDRPLSNAPVAIGNYQAARQKFMDCVRGEAGRDSQTMQQDLDRSLAAIGDDQLDVLDGIHQDTRGLADRRR